MSDDGNDSTHKAIYGATPAVRLKKSMDALLKYRASTGKIHYTQSASRMTIVRHHLLPPFNGITIYEDCSSMVTGCYRMAGLHDPNELHFSGWGYTGTLVKCGKAVNKPFAVGDLVFYGGTVAVPHHVAMVYSVGKAGAKVFSHGHEGGPVVEPLDYRSDRRSTRRYF